MYKMAVLPKIKSHSDVVDYFKELPFYNKLIEKLPFYNKLIEKPKVKYLKNIDQLAEIPFYEQLSVIKANQAFRYVMSYKVEIVERKIPIVQLETTKSSIKDLFSDLLIKICLVSDYYKSFVKKNTSSMEKLNLLQFILIQ